MKPSPRVAVAGCGSIARAHVQAVGAANLVALCDANLDYARRLRDELNVQIPVFASLDEALEQQKPDVVVVCTPPATHFALAGLALQAGADVLCEKPLATRADDARALVDLARACKRTLRTGAKYRFCEGVEAAQALVKSGECGDLIEARIAFGSAFDPALSWHSNPALSGGGVWMDNGPHALDLARHFAGELKLESVKQWRTRGPIETEAHLEFSSVQGAPVEIELSWQRSLGEEFAVLHCARGTLRVGWRETTWQRRGEAERILAGAYDKTACFAGNWNCFRANDARCQAQDGARVVELLEAVYRAARVSDSA